MMNSEILKPIAINKSKNKKLNEIIKMSSNWQNK